MYAIVLIFFPRNFSPLFSPQPRAPHKFQNPPFCIISQMNGKPRAARNLVLVYITFFPSFSHFLLLLAGDGKRNFHSHSQAIIFIMPWHHFSLNRRLKINENNISVPFKYSLRGKESFLHSLVSEEPFFNHLDIKNPFFSCANFQKPSQPIHTILMEIYSACTFFVSISTQPKNPPTNPSRGKFFQLSHTHTEDFSRFFPPFLRQQLLLFFGEILMFVLLLMICGCE